MNLVLLPPCGCGRFFSEAISTLVFTELLISLNLESLTTTCGSAGGRATEVRWEAVCSTWLRQMELVMVGSMVSTKSLLRLQMVLSLCFLRISSSMKEPLCRACFFTTAFPKLRRRLAIQGVSLSAKYALLSPIGVLSEKYLLWRIMEYSRFSFWMMPSRSRRSISTRVRRLPSASEISWESSCRRRLDFLRCVFTTSSVLFSQ